MAFARLGLALGLHLRARTRELPQWLLFLPIAGLAIPRLSR